MIRIAMPNKGRLAEPSRELIKQAGLTFSHISGRALQAKLGEEFLALFVRANDIPEFVADGAADLGITGRDLVRESGRSLRELLDLEFGRCRLAVAVRDEDTVRSVDDIPDGTPVATSFPVTSEAFFAAKGRRVTLVPVSGAAEIAPHLGVADIIVDLVSTGSTLKTNGLREISTVMESSAVLVGRSGVPEGGEDDAIVRDLTDALESVVCAKNKRYLMANVPRSALDEVRRVLPGVSGPTIIDILNGGNLVAAHAVIGQSEAFAAIARLRQLGATGILLTKIERLSP
ncbi:MAG TPA: ATP phosphoribosyltransferase [Acidobacteriota bacterium]|nr:ATP phosphoribosyltransferase [Acidobacteriota bacterium]